MGYYRNLSAQIYRERAYTSDPVTLALGICEEAGEIGKAVNMFHNPLYIPSGHSQSDTVEHEIKDILIYLAALSNALNLEIDF